MELLMSWAFRDAADKDAVSFLGSVGSTVVAIALLVASVWRATSTSRRALLIRFLLGFSLGFSGAVKVRPLVDGSCLVPEI